MMKNKKAITQIDLIMVIVLVVVLTIIVLYVNVCNRMRELQMRVHCGHRLKGLGAALVMYQNDFNDANPIVWGDEVTNGQFGMGLYNKAGGTEISRWVNPNFDDWDNQTTVGGCLYLLVKYEDVSLKSFICPSAPCDEVSYFEDAVGVCRENGWAEPEDWADLNDFQSMVNLSYSYNDPWANPTGASTPVHVALLADKSPAYDTETGARNPEAGDFPIQKDSHWDDYQGNNPRHGLNAKFVAKSRTVI